MNEPNLPPNARFFNELIASFQAQERQYSRLSPLIANIRQFRNMAAVETTKALASEELQSKLELLRKVNPARASQAEQAFRQMHQQAVELVLLSSISEALKQIDSTNEAFKSIIHRINNYVQKSVIDLQNEAVSNYSKLSEGIEDIIIKKALDELFVASSYTSCSIRPEMTWQQEVKAVAGRMLQNPSSFAVQSVADDYIAPFAEDLKQAIAAKNRELYKVPLPAEGAQLNQEIKRYRLPRDNDQSINVFEGVLTKSNISRVDPSKKVHVVFCHGNASSASLELKDFNKMMQKMLEENPDIDQITYSIVDYPASAASGGKYKNIQEVANDSVVNVIKHKIRCGESPSNFIVVGHSLGGYIGTTGVHLLQKDSIDVSLVSLDSLSNFSGWLKNSTLLEKLFLANYSVDAVRYFQDVDKDRRFVSAKFGDEVINISNSMLFALNENKDARIKYERLLSSYGDLGQIEHNLRVLDLAIQLRAADAKGKSPESKEQIELAKFKKLRNELVSDVAAKRKKFNDRYQNDPDMITFDKLQTQISKLKILRLQLESGEFKGEDKINEYIQLTDALNKECDVLIKQLFDIKFGILQPYNGGHSGERNEAIITTAVLSNIQHRREYNQQNDNKVFAEIKKQVESILRKDERFLKGFNEKAIEIEVFVSLHEDQFTANPLLKSQILLGYLYQESKVGPHKKEFDELFKKKFGYLEVDKHYLEHCERLYNDHEKRLQEQPQQLREQSPIWQPKEPLRAPPPIPRPQPNVKSPPSRSSALEGTEVGVVKPVIPEQSGDQPPSESGQQRVWQPKGKLREPPPVPVATSPKAVSHRPPPRPPRTSEPLDLKKLERQPSGGSDLLNKTTRPEEHLVRKVPQDTVVRNKSPGRRQ